MDGAAEDVGAARLAIRRPDQSRPGGPPPWAGLPAAARRNIGLGRVVAAVRRPDRRSVLPEPWPPVLVEGRPPRPAAVLVPLFEESDEARVVLTVRSSQLRSHRGEVAFPGGRLEPGEDVVDAALREASEEIGLDPDTAAVVGTLTTRSTAVSYSVMTPVVATLPGRPVLTARPAEVARTFDVSLAELLADGVFHEELWAVPGRVGSGGVVGAEFPVWFFAAGGETIWGATARTLVELCCLVLDLPPAESGRPS
ncbi:MAG: CoA pyrophosphatase [Acidimicrobiales bacterium]|nr:CoA pyrophosphatase [Acidimicrobiales bacterium]